MSDWLSEDTGDDYLGLGLDNPEMPQTALAPPTAEQADGWLSDTPAPAPGFDAGAAPVMDTQGDWFGGDTSGSHGGAPTHDPYAAQQQSHDPYAAHGQAATMAPPAQLQGTGYNAHPAAPAPMAQSFDGDLQVSAPMLDHVQPNPRSLGGSRGHLSNLVLDVEVQVEVGLGNAALTVEEFLEMGRGSVVELDTPIDAPIELKVRGKLIARGQLVSINGSYGMRIVEMINEEN